MDDKNDNASRARAGVDEGAHASERGPAEDSKFTALFHALKHHDLIASDARVLGAMLTLARGDLCTHTRRRLSAESGVHEASIRRSVDRLTAAGFIEAARSRGRTANAYRLILDPANRSVRAPVGSPNRSVRARVAARTGAPVGGLQPERACTGWRGQPEHPRSSCSKAPALALSDLALVRSEGLAVAEELGRQSSRKSDQSSKPPEVAAGRRKSGQQQTEAPEAAPTPTPAAGLWADGLQWLMTSCNLKDSTARGFLGRFVKAAGSSETALQLIAEAKRQQVAGPQAWLMAAAKARRTPAGAVPRDTRTDEQIDADNAAEARRLGYV